jgi:hypothetical protein
MLIRPFSLTALLLPWLATALIAATKPADVPRPPAPEFPTAAQTPTWTPPADVIAVEKLPAKQPDFEKALGKLVKQSPEKLGLPAGVSIRIDSVQLVPEAVGIPPMAFVHITQVADSTPVAGTEGTLVFQWGQEKSPLRITEGRLYPAVKALPEKALTAEEAEKKVWDRLTKDMTRFETAHGGTWVRWIDGKWRTIQVYGVTPQNLIAAVDGSGTVFVWGGRLLTKPAVDTKNTKPL